MSKRFLADRVAKLRQIEMEMRCQRDNLDGLIRETRNVITAMEADLARMTTEEFEMQSRVARIFESEPN